MPAKGKVQKILRVVCTPEPMEVIINNHTIEIPQSASLSDALALAGIQSPAGIAIAVNNEVVPKTSWENTALDEKDEILVIQATQGG